MEPFSTCQYMSKTRIHMLKSKSNNKRSEKKVIVNSCVVLDKQKSAPSNLPRETAVKVRIAEFFVHHASRKKNKKKVI
jgi:hypothetical protein